MGIRNVLHSKPGQIIISVLLGLGLSTLFRKVCNERNCIVFKGPQLNKVKGQIFKFNERCYQFDEKIENCDDTKKIVNFA